MVHVYKCNMTNCYNAITLLQLIRWLVNIISQFPIDNGDHFNKTFHALGTLKCHSTLE